MYIDEARRESFNPATVKLPDQRPRSERKKKTKKMKTKKNFELNDRKFIASRSASKFIEDTTREGTTERRRQYTATQSELAPSAIKPDQSTLNSLQSSTAQYEIAIGNQRSVRSIHS